MDRSILKLLLFLVYLNSFANSFFSDEFINSSVVGFSPAQLINGIFLLIFILYNIPNTSARLWSFLSPIIILLIYNLIAAIWSPYPLIAIVFSFKILFLVNIFLVVAILTKKGLLGKNQISLLAKRVIIITIVGQIIGLYLGTTMYNTEYSSAGLSDNGSVISAQILFTLPALLLVGFKNKKNLLFYFLIIVSILLTLRRSAFIAFVLVFITILFFKLVSSKIRRQEKIKWIGITTIGSFIIYGILIFSDIGISFLERISELDPEQGNGSGRYSFQYLGLKYLLNRDWIATIFGEGFGYSIIVNVQNGFIPIGMHSDLLDVIIGLGLIGFLLLILFFNKILKLIKNIPISYNFFNSILSVFVTFISMAFFTGGIFELNTMFGYLSLGFVYSHFKRIKYA